MRPMFLILVFLWALNLGCGHADQETRSGSTPQPSLKPVATDPIPDLPDYPGSTRTAYVRGDDSSQGFSRTVRAEMSTNDSFDDVIKFYSKASRESGWKPINFESRSAAADESRMILNYSKDGSNARIEISKKGNAAVTITLERKDK